MSDNNNDNSPSQSLVISIDPTPAITILIQQPFRVVAIRRQIAHTWQLVTSSVTPQAYNTAPHLPPPASSVPANIHPPNGRVASAYMLKYEGISSFYKGTGAILIRQGMNNIAQTAFSYMVLLSVLNIPRPNISTDHTTLQNNTQLVRDIMTQYQSQLKSIPYYYALLGTMFASIIVYPFDVASTRLSAQPATHPIKQNISLFKRYISLFPVLRSVINESTTIPSQPQHVPYKSIRHIYTGYLPYLSRVSIIALSTLWLSKYMISTQQILKLQLQRYVDPSNGTVDVDKLTEQQRDQLRLNMLTVFAFQPLLSITLYPLSTITHTMQVHGMLTQYQSNNSMAVTYQAKYYNTIRAACSDIYGTYGMKGFYRGVVPSMYGLMTAAGIISVLTGVAV